MACLVSPSTLHHPSSSERRKRLRTNAAPYFVEFGSAVPPKEGRQCMARRWRSESGSSGKASKVVSLPSTVLTSASLLSCSQSKWIIASCCPATAAMLGKTGVVQIHATLVGSKVSLVLHA